MVTNLYVDDLLMAGNDRLELLRIKKPQSQHFKMKDLGALEDFLAIKVT